MKRKLKIFSMAVLESLQVIGWAILVAGLMNGCATSGNAQPAKSATMNNDFRDCIIVVATHASVSNRVVDAQGTKEAPAIDLFTIVQSLETGGNDATTQTATQTPTTDVKPDIDVSVPVTKSAAAGAAADLVGAAASAVKAACTSSTSDCKDGSCTARASDCADGSCSD